MAQQNARLQAVEERQLKPIYEALDTGNAKSALTQCNKLLKKYPSPPPPGSALSAPANSSTNSRQLITALKILALVRGNKLDEASALTTALLEETPTEDSVLSTLAHSLKPLDRPKDMVGMWVNAWNRSQKECDEMKKRAAKIKGSKGLLEAEISSKMQQIEELGAQAFMAMVKTGHWAMAQSTAFKLYRAFAPPKGQEEAQAPPALRYLYWSVMASLMQSDHPNPPPPVPVLVMIPPPASVKEWEDNRKKEEEEDRKLLEDYVAKHGAPPQTTGPDLSLSRRKKRTLALTLAQRLIETMVETKEAEAIGPQKVLRGMTVERLWLWGDVLRRIAEAGDQDNGPAEESRWLVPNQLLSTPLVHNVANNSLHLEELRADVAKKASDWKQEAETMAMRLDKGNRNWTTFSTFFDAMFKFFKNAGDSPNQDNLPCLVQSPEPPTPKQEGEGADTEKTEQETTPAPEPTKTPLTLAETRKFVYSLAEKDDAKVPTGERASHLGVLEFERRVRNSGLADEGAPNYVDALTAYFDMFGTKAVLLEDLLPYVRELEGDEKAKWDAHLEKIVQSTSDLNTVQQTINILKLQRLSSSSDATTIDSELQFAKHCLKLYIEALPLGKELVSTELQPADDLALLAASALLNAYYIQCQGQAPSEETPALAQDKFVALLLDALVVLEQGASKSRWAYPFRLLLVRLYRLLGAPALALQNFTMANLKGIQHDTLSHHVLSRASTFSLGSAGDLSLINECVESSQIYAIHGVDVSEQLVKAFQFERYSQIAEFVLLEDKVENSLQRDLTKLEHFRMKNVHEGLTPENVEVELVELRFVWSRTHHDNRDFALLPNFQPQGAASIEDITSIGGRPLSKQWFITMLQLWILILHESSEQLWTEEEQTTVLSKLRTFNEADLQQLTAAEQLFFKFSRACIAWLAPHHAPLKHAVMTNAVSTLSAAKAKYAATTNGAAATSVTGGVSNSKAKSNIGKKSNGLSNGTEGTAASGGEGGIGVKVGDMKVFTGMLTLHEPMEVPPIPKDLGEPVKEPPTEILDMLDEFQKLFDDTLAKPTSLPWEHLHVAQMVHETVFVAHLLTARFALGGSKKKTHPSFKLLRFKAMSLLEHAAQEITKLGDAIDFSPETRQKWLQDRRSSGVLDILPDQEVSQVGKTYLESKKKMFEQLGKGMTKAQQTLPKSAAGVPAGTN